MKTRDIEAEHNYTFTTNMAWYTSEQVPSGESTSRQINFHAPLLYMALHCVLEASLTHTAVTSVLEQLCVVHLSAHFHQLYSIMAARQDVMKSTITSSYKEKEKVLTLANKIEVVIEISLSWTNEGRKLGQHKVSVHFGSLFIYHVKF